MRGQAEFVIIGAGIAGASLASELSSHTSVILLERESQPGYHTTGRSAAVYTEIYGNEAIRALTIASRSFFATPPEGFAEGALWHPRPVVMVGRADQRAEIEEHYQRSVRLVPEVERLDEMAVRRHAEMLRPGYAVGGVLDPHACDLDVHAIHQGFLRTARKAGCEIVTNADVRGLNRTGAGWEVETSAGTVVGRVVVNAAGAWADVIAELAGVRPIGLVPKRRTALIFTPAPPRRVDHWPAVVDVSEAFYFKPDAGKVLASPADETPSPPCDAQPEEIDIAIAVDRIGKAVDFTIPAIHSKWAGLRSFVADKTPVAGFDSEVQGFFWLAGQGGYGIQTAPAMARAAAALALEQALPEDVVRLGVAPETLSPGRLERRRVDTSEVREYRATDMSAGGGT